MVLFFKLGFWLGYNSNLGAFMQQLSIFIMLDYAKSSKTYYSALGGVVFKSGVHYEPIGYFFSFKLTKIWS